MAAPRSARQQAPLVPNQAAGALERHGIWDQLHTLWGRQQFHPEWPGALDRLGFGNRFIQQRERQFRTERPGAPGRRGIGNRFHNFRD